MQLAYLLIPSSLAGKSLAGQIEAEVIQDLNKLGYNVLSTRDARNRSRPRRAAPDVQSIL